MPFAVALLLLLVSAAVEMLEQAGVEPKKVAWQVAIEPSAASRLGRLPRDSATGQIRGRVFDEDGASIPDASVAFEPLDSRSGLAPFDAVADSRGRFDFIRVRPGTYRVTAKALGFETTVMIQEVAAGVENEVTVVVRRRPSSAGHSTSRRADYLCGSPPFVETGDHISPALLTDRLLKPTGPRPAGFVEFV